MERPEGDEDPETEEKKPEYVRLRHLAERPRCKGVAENHQVEASGPGLHVDGDEPDEREHRAQREVHRHHHRGVAAVPAAPDSHHDEGRDEGQLVEKIEEKHVHARERPHEAGLHHEQKQQVRLHPLRLGLDRIEACRKADQPRQDEKRERYPVQPELEPDPEPVEARGVIGEKRIAVDLLRGRGEPPPYVDRHEGGHRESRVRKLDGPALGQAERDRDRDGQRRGDRDQEGVKGHVHRGVHRTPAAKAQSTTTPPRNQ